MNNKLILQEYSGFYGIVDMAYQDMLSPVDWVKIFIKNSVRVIQLRAKAVDDIDFYNTAKELRKIIPEDFLFIINDRADIALLTDADGVHLGQRDVLPSAVREKWDTLVIGLSTHNMEQLKIANTLKVDYVGFGPVFPTTSKEVPDPVVGIEGLKRAREFSFHPVVAIGGINLENLEKIIKDICPDFFAVISAIALSEDPEEEVFSLQEEYMKFCKKT